MVQKLLIFVEGRDGRGGGIEIIRFSYRFHSLHPEHSYTYSSDGCSTQQRQKIIKQITKTCKSSTVNINLPLETVKRP